jgi:aminopeptidase
MSRREKMLKPGVRDSISEAAFVETLAQLTVRFGANLQRGQILAIRSEPGKEALARAIADVAYREGARYVDLSVFDPHFKRSRVLHADPDSLAFVPPWLGARALALGENRCATVVLTGPVEPELMDGVDPGLLARDMLPSLPEGVRVIDERTTNWTAVPCPTASWARVVYRELDPEAALARLRRDLAHICRLGEPDPIAAWEQRLAHLDRTAGRLDALGLDALRFDGPGTELTIGLLAGARWAAARFETVDGIVHVPNIPTEEVFTTPDPERVEGFVTATKPLFTSETTITGLRVRFEGGRAVEFEADRGVEVLRGLSERDAGGSRLGEVALVDREGRIGPLETVFFDTLIDENATSHIALGQGYEIVVEDPGDRERVNQSEIHVDFMIGGDAVSVTGLRADGNEISLLRNGTWQI